MFLGEGFSTLLTIETYNIWGNSQNILHESKLVNKLSLVNTSITIEKRTESNGMTRLTP